MKYLFSFALVFVSSVQLQAQGNLDLDPCIYPFYHGVASGDPLSDRVIIWSRVTPDSLGGSAVVVSYKMATDTGMTNIVAQGSGLTDANKDYTIKFDVTGLDPKTFYYYEFEAMGYRSQVGRTRTTPSDSESSDTLRFGLVSCANLEAGYFNVYKVLNERNDMDAVLMLGDYIYEYETGGYSPNPSTNRFWEPATEIMSLGDYRMRYSTYHLDSDLRRNHQLYPWICVWDDHESANDSWKNGAENHTEGTEGTWTQRKSWAKQAYFEWLPIRETGMTDPHQIYRKIEYGQLVDLYMLDTRLHGRDEQDGTSGGTVESEFRELLGSDQRTWLESELTGSNAQWQTMVQQVMVAPLEMFGVGLNGDQWDGYPAERQRLYDMFADNNIENLVVVTGDIHTSWANDLPSGTYDGGTGAGSYGVEFVTPSVTSPGSPIGFVEGAIQLSNPHMKYINLTEHGFILLDYNTSRVQGDWFFVDEIDNDNGTYGHASSWYCDDDTKHLQSASGVAIPPDYLTSSIQPDLCPRVSIDSVDDVGIHDDIITVLSIYPNPASDWFMIHYHLQDAGAVQMQIVDQKGAIVKSFETEKVQGLWIEKYPVDDIKPGIYFIRIVSKKGASTQKLIIK